MLTGCFGTSKKRFFDKCYICEKQYIDGINVEHFEPHRDLDMIKKFDWNNLFGLVLIAME